jgi:HK97 family phage prohead protease
VVFVLLTKAFKFDAKAAEDKLGQFSGRASVYGVVDSYNDVVMPGAFTKSLEALAGRIPVLNQHNPSDVIGYASLKDSDTALLADGQLVLELASAKDAYTRLQHGLIDGISIGYEVLSDAYVNGVRQLQEIKLWEISLVTFPANAFARVTDVKSVFAEFADMPLAQKLQALDSTLADVKAGRVLSAGNRSKVQEVMQLLQELLDAADPDKAAEQAAANALLTNLRAFNAAAKK